MNKWEIIFATSRPGEAAGGGTINYIIKYHNVIGTGLQHTAGTVFTGITEDSSLLRKTKIK